MTILLLLCGAVGHMRPWVARGSFATATTSNGAVKGEVMDGVAG